jgi:hypothetical protein
VVSTLTFDKGLINALIGKVEKWSSVNDEALARNGALSYTGSVDGWTFLVVRFTVDGRVGHDGTAASATRGAVFRLPHDVAEFAFKTAASKTSA